MRQHKTIKFSLNLRRQFSISDLSEYEADVKVIASDMNFGNCYCLNPELDFKPLDNSAPELFSSFNFQQLIDFQLESAVPLYLQPYP